MELLLEKINKMELLREAYSFIDANGWHKKYHVFLCPYCNKEVLRPKSHGKRDKSCGCMRYNHGHGYSRKNAVTRLYKTWEGMIQRATNPSSEYKNWNGRGITICEEWKKFNIFKDWALKNRYADNLYIDRIDNDGNYSPENCRFVTHAENSRNRRTNKLNWHSVGIIRELYSSRGLTQQKISTLFNVSAVSISSIVNNKTWKI